MKMQQRKLGRAINRNMGRKHFSLPELAVIAAVLAIAGALQLAAFPMGMGVARGTACTEQLKQNGLRFMMYMDDHQGWITLNSYNKSAKPVTVHWADVLYREQERGPVVRCPDLPLPPGAARNHTGFAYGTWAFVPTAGKAGEKFVRDAKAFQTRNGAYYLNGSQLSAAAETPLLADSLRNWGKRYGLNQAHIFDLGGKTGLDLRHNGFGNVLYADGHAAAINAGQSYEHGYATCWRNGEQTPSPHR